MQKKPLNITMVKKIPPPILLCLSKKVLEKSKMHQCILMFKGKDMPSPPLFYAQVTYQASNILKIKEAFLVLLDKKILEIYNAVTLNSHLGNKSDIFHYNHKNNQLERQVQPPKNVS